jgi:hypothetical protein
MCLQSAVVGEGVWGGPCGGQGTQQGGRQKDWAEKPVRVPGPSEIGRRGEAHCWPERIVVLREEMLEEEFNAILG